MCPPGDEFTVRACPFLFTSWPDQVSIHWPIKWASPLYVNGIGHQCWVPCYTGSAVLVLYCNPCPCEMVGQFFVTMSKEGGHISTISDW